MTKKQEAHGFWNRAKNLLAQAYHWIVCSEDYLQSMEEEQVSRGALAPKARDDYLRAEQDCKRSYQALHDRAGAFSEVLGRGYRGHVEARAVRKAVSAHASGE